MRLLINTSLLRFGGAVQVALSFIYECRLQAEHEYHVVLGPGVGAVLDPADFPANFRFYEKSFGVMTLHKLPRVAREMTALEAKVLPECVVTTSGPAYWRSRTPHLMGFNLPLYIYSESPFLKAMSPLKKARLAARRWLHCRYFRRDADALLVQTDDANQRVRRLLGTDCVYTVTNNHSAWFDNPPTAPLRLPEEKGGVLRFLSVTSYYAHKNLEIIPQILRQLPKEISSRLEFVLTLTPKEYRQQIEREIPKQTRLVGPVPPPECPALYAECDAMFLPTLAECFSASYPEAMKMEKPIVTTDLGFARSICGEAALYFRPGDAQSAAQQIAHLFQNESVQRVLIERGRKRLAAFDSPAERAEKIIAICQKLVRDRDQAHATVHRC